MEGTVTQYRADLSLGVPVRGMSEEEVRLLLDFLEKKAAEFWKHYESGPHRESHFKWEAKRFEDVEFFLFRILEGKAPRPSSPSHQR